MPSWLSSFLSLCGLVKCVGTQQVGEKLNEIAPL